MTLVRLPPMLAALLACASLAQAGPPSPVPRRAPPTATPRGPNPPNPQGASVPRTRDTPRTGPTTLEVKEPITPEELERGAVTDKKRDESIDSLKKIIPKIEDGNPQKADMLFQLSELYWEKSRFLHRKEMLALFDAQRVADEKRTRSEPTPEPTPDHRQSELFRSETVRLCETILREYPSYERKDEVLFNLAFNLYETNKRVEAVKRYLELIKTYPGSKFVSDAYVQLGNHFFEVDNALDKARAMYERAFATNNPRIKSYALYKLAWCDFNSGQHEGALEKLHQVIDFGETQGKDRTFTDLKNEALNDSVRVYVQLNRGDEARAYFKTKATTKRQTGLISKLAYALQDAGHHESAVRSFRALLQDDPSSESAPDYQQAIIKSYEGLRLRDQVQAEVKNLATLYRPGSDWWRANASKKAVLRNGFSVAEEAMRTTVTEYHLEAQKTKQVATYRLARDIYKQYVDAFAHSDDESFVSDQAFNLKFYYAEILWALEDWHSAAREYDSVTTFKIPNRTEAREASHEKYRQQAAYNAILAYAKLVKIERGQLAPADDREGRRVEETQKKGTIQKTGKIHRRSAKELEEKPLTAFETALVAACDRYNAKHPGNVDEVDVAYQAAVIFYDKNRFVEAARRFGEIITRHPAESRSQDAADLSMAALEEKEEWLELNTLARRFRDNPTLVKPGSDFAKRVSAIVEGSQYKYVDEVVYRRDKNAKKAFEAFLAFAAEFPKSDNADRALTYAMVISHEAHELARAVEIGERLLREYPHTIFDLKVKYTLATLYERLAYFEKAAATYEEFVATYDLAAEGQGVGLPNRRDATSAKSPGPAGRPAVSTVALRALKDEAQKKDRQALIAECVDPKDNWVLNASFNAGHWYEGVGRLDQALAAYARFLTRFGNEKEALEVALKIGQVLGKQRKWAEEAKHYEGLLLADAKDNRLGEVRRLELRYRHFLIAGRLKQPAEQERLAREIAATYPKLKEDDRKSDRARVAVAHAKFSLLEPAFKAYSDLKFKNLGTFKKDRENKEKRLGELYQGYTEVLEAKNPEYAIAALTRIGQVYGDFAASIAQIPDPPRLDEDQLAMFRSELENRYVLPVEAKAVEALETALAKSYELSLYSEWTLLAQDRLNTYKPGLYPTPRSVPFRSSESFATGGFERNASWPHEVTLGRPGSTPPGALPPPGANPL